MKQFTLPDLPYRYDALAPVISESIMRLHHDTHHATYVAKLNAALVENGNNGGDDWDDEQRLVEILASLDSLPDAVRTIVRNNGGGHYNHSLFWQCMAPGGRTMPSTLQAAIESHYGSVDAFKEAFTTAALGVFGSGWVWLQPDMSIVASPNQDSPVMTGEKPPILGLDVWEHAYYLDYFAARKEYVDAWWAVVDWEFVARRHQAYSS